MTDSQFANSEAAPEQVRPFAWYRADRGWFMGNEHGREFGPAWTPLYTRPDERVAMLEGLLREWIASRNTGTSDEIDVLERRTDVALNEG